MSKALVNNETKDITNAKSGEIGECLVCKKFVIAKRGEIKAIHWAHVGNESVYDIESHNEWHISWKKFFERIGYTTEKKFGNFIADAYNSKTSTVIEYQHSPITSQEIVDRCKHHKNENRNIKWIFDYTNKYKDGHVELYKKNDINNCEFCYEFVIKWAIKSYTQGIFNNEIRHLNIQSYFDIIHNYNSNLYSSLDFIRNTKIDYNTNKNVLLKISNINWDHKSGWGEIIFM